MATALICFDDMDIPRCIDTQKHCILICNSPPYSMPVMECHSYENKNVEQLATIFQEKNINLSILSPRKIPVLFKLFEKAGGDLSSSTSKNYSKDPRHLVLLKGFSLKERPISPTTIPGVQGAITNMPSPLNPNTNPNPEINPANVNPAMRGNMNNPSKFQFHLNQFLFYKKKSQFSSAIP